MPLAVGYDPAETTHDAFVGRDLVVPGRYNVTVNEKVDTCDASNASHIPNRHRGCDLVAVRRRIAGGGTIFDPIDLERWPGQKVTRRTNAATTDNASMSSLAGFF